ncbi:MAG: tRNA (N(6)-L-threonylcarbamoyladenosine(37)-C(2))-methylthiotransferase MtaB [Candidatus Bipolaricaulota bacterium]|nr:tRNA (N(6)-L-threonylcarbamoyladenosine(37)-C(2))-methylthiotransferase MtaB [Candidatus Bipolaricaulota bacterium]
MRCILYLPMKSNLTDRRITLITFGCRVNQYETQMMRELLTPRFQIVSSDADVYVVNACTVTSLAERKARQTIHRLHRESPSAKIIVIGCVGDAVASDLSRLDQVDLIAGNGWKTRVNEAVERALAGETGLLPTVRPMPMENERISRHAGRVRTFLKVQDGCDFACTFCRTTQVRGPSRSKPITAIIDEARRLVENGYPEIVLTGINLAQFSSPNGNIASLSKRLLQIESLRRLRLASINPYGIDDELVRTFARSDRACPHFHIPLQSGDDDVLRAMARGYNREFYLSRVELIRRDIPQATFGADMIVGFPGENDAAFRQTLSMIEQVRFANLHLFRYSPRAGTIAARARDQVSEAVKRARAEEAEQVYRRLQQDLLSSYIKETLSVLLEEKTEDGWRGYTRGYISVQVHTAMQHNPGDEIAVRIVSAQDGYLLGDE